MAYSQVTLGALTSQISTLLDDPAARYWTVPEITFAIQESLRVWGALTGYWRTRGAFNLVPSSPSPFVDLSVVLPNLRSRSWTLDQMVRQIQFMCLEPALGIGGVGMSGQISVASILQSISRARNQFVIDTHLPISVHESFSPPSPPNGMVSFAQSSVFVHRAAWQDVFSGVWTNLWREDAWAVDHGNPTWPTDAGDPAEFSEAESAPLKLQISPVPLNSGSLEALTVDSLILDLTNPNQTFNVPDEWVHAIMYGALADIFNAESQNKDPIRANYADHRYQQAISAARDARSIIRVLVAGEPTPVDTLAAVDAGVPRWRNLPGYPSLFGVLYDLITPACIPDAPYGVAVDVVQSAPIPTLPGDFLQIGIEDIPRLVDYITHILTFKCGGKEFTDTFSGYDSFMTAVAGRKQINSAKIKYLGPLLAQAQREWSERPDRIEAIR